MKYIYYLICWIIGMPLACLSPQQTNEAPVSLLWEMGANEVESGYYENTFYLVNHAKERLAGNWTIYFNQMPAAVKKDVNLPVVIEQISSTYYRMYPSPEYIPVEAGDTLRIIFRCEGSILKTIGAPEGVYIVMKDKKGREMPPRTVPVCALPFDKDYQWNRAGVNELPYPDGKRIYESNAVFTEEVLLEKTDIFPSPKSVKTKGGEFVLTKTIGLVYDPGLENEGTFLKDKFNRLYGCIFSDDAPVTIRLGYLPASVTRANNEYYEMELQDGSIRIEGVSAHAVFNGIQTLFAMIRTDQLPYELPNVAIADYPDFSYRGQMLDVARNFSSKTDILRLLDILSAYKINVFHFHLTDDEGWRLEIPGLEELTTTGARRGHTPDEREQLYPAYGGGWDPNDPGATGTGFYSRTDFIDILKYAQARHITVIPEIDLPGHARAAIKAMNARYYTYIESDPEKAEEFLLTDFSDTSTYLSAQSYTDNVINVAMPSAYRFVRKVVDEVCRMYEEAGHELTVLHLGGDEVAQGAWTGSEIASAFMKEKGFTEIRELKDYFIEQVLAIFKERGLQLGAWQEVALLPDETVNGKFREDNVLSYCWNTVPDWESDEIPYRLANAGYPVILSNVTNFYFDLAYSKHPDDPGAYWGGFVNEYNSFDVVPYDIYKSVRCDMSGCPVDIVRKSKERIALQPSAVRMVKGLQGQVWAETIRNFDGVEYYLFPKIYGLVERAWNATPQWTNDPLGETYKKDLRRYQAKIARHELPRLAFHGVNFRVSPPGIQVIEDRLYMNSSIPGGEIRYTLDGSEPTLHSPVWKEPELCDAKEIRAKLFYCGKESITILYRE